MEPMAVSSLQAIIRDLMEENQALKQDLVRLGGVVHSLHARLSIAQDRLKDVEAPPGPISVEQNGIPAEVSCELQDLHSPRRLSVIVNSTSPFSSPNTLTLDVGSGVESPLPVCSPIIVRSDSGPVMNHCDGVPSGSTASAVPHAPCQGSTGSIPVSPPHTPMALPVEREPEPTLATPTSTSTSTSAPTSRSFISHVSLGRDAGGTTTMTTPSPSGSTTPHSPQPGDVISDPTIRPPASSATCTWWTRTASGTPVLFQSRFSHTVAERTSPRKSSPPSPPRQMGSPMAHVSHRTAVTRSVSHPNPVLKSPKQSSRGVEDTMTASVTGNRPNMAPGRHSHSVTQILNSGQTPRTSGKSFAAAPRSPPTSPKWRPSPTPPDPPVRVSRVTTSPTGEARPARSSMTATPTSPARVSDLHRRPTAREPNFGPNTNITSLDPSGTSRSRRTAVTTSSSSTTTSRAPSPTGSTASAGVPRRRFS